MQRFKVFFEKQKLNDIEAEIEESECNLETISELEEIRAISPGIKLS